jgi:predicted nucleic acid-binding Zn ribbon protein
VSPAEGPPPPRRRRRRPGPDPGPRPLAEGLDDAVARLSPKGVAGPPATSLSAVFTRWEEIAGEAVARHVQPVRLSGGVLVVAADHPAWATQVRALGAGLLVRVGEVSGTAPTRLEVTVRATQRGPRNGPPGGGVG